MTFPRVSIRRLGAVQLGKMLQPSPKVGSDIAAQYLRAAHVQPWGVLDMSVEPKTMYFARGELQLHDLRRGDVVVVEGGAGFGRAAVLTQDLVGWGFQNSIVRIRPFVGRSHGAFVAYALHAALAAGEIEVACFTSTIPHFTADKVSAFELPAPSLAAQHRIANYLDRETAQIDTLISEQQRLIELIREREAGYVRNLLHGFPFSPAIINASLPAGWEMRQIGHLGRARSGSGFPPHLQGESGNPIPFYKVQHLGNADLSGVLRKPSDSITRETAEALRAHVFPPGTIVYAKVGAALLLGRFRVLPGIGCIDNNMAGFTPGPAVKTEYMRLVLSQLDFRLAANPGAVPSLNTNHFLTLRVPVPPRAEQDGIVDAADAHQQKTQLVIAEAERLIELARERRAALITAAVTGQIELPED